MPETGQQEATEAGAPPLLLILLIVAAAHVTALFGDFLFDDFPNLQNALEAGWSPSRLASHFEIDPRQVHDGVTLPSFTRSVRYFRPLFLASLLLDHALWGLRPFGYHLTNLVLHLAVVAMFYAVLRQLLPQRRDMAWFAALLFGILPHHCVCVSWLSGRTELLPALAMLVALWAFLRFMQGRAPLAYVLSLVAVSLGLLAKENAVIFPVIVFAAWLWLVPRPRPTALWLLPYFLVVALYLLLRRHALGGFPLPPQSFYYHSPTEPGFVWWAMAKSVCVFLALPTQLHFLYPVEMLLSRHPVLTAVLFALTAAAALGLLRFVRGPHDDRWRRLGYFGMVWVIAGMVPTAPIFLTALYFYFPLLGVCLLYLVVWQRLGEWAWPRRLERRRWRRAIPVALMIVFVTGLQLGNLVFLLGSRWSRQMIRQIVAVVGQPADDSHIYLIDAPLVTGWIKTAMQLEWPDRPFALSILSVSPYLTKRQESGSTLEQPDDRTLQMTAVGRPYWAGLLGAVAGGDRGPDFVQAGQVWEAPTHRVRIDEVEQTPPFERNAIRRVTVSFEQPLRTRGNLFLRYVEGRFEKIDFR